MHPGGRRHYNEYDIQMGLAEFCFMVPAYKMAPAARQAPPAAPLPLCPLCRCWLQ